MNFLWSVAMTLVLVIPIQEYLNSAELIFALLLILFLSWIAFILEDIKKKLK